MADFEYDSDATEEEEVKTVPDIVTDLAAKLNDLIEQMYDAVATAEAQLDEADADWTEKTPRLMKAMEKVTEELFGRVTDIEMYTRTT